MVESLKAVSLKKYEGWIDQLKETIAGIEAITDPTPAQLRTKEEAELELKEVEVVYNAYRERPDDDKFPHG